MVRREDIIGQFPEYIGDGVYASFDGYQVWLQTGRSSKSMNCIALEPPLIKKVQAYYDNIVSIYAGKLVGPDDESTSEDEPDAHEG